MLRAIGNELRIFGRFLKEVIFKDEYEKVSSTGTYKVIKEASSGVVYSILSILFAIALVAFLPTDVQSSEPEVQEVQEQVEVQRLQREISSYMITVDKLTKRNKHLLEQNKKIIEEANDKIVKLVEMNKQLAKKNEMLVEELRTKTVAEVAEPIEINIDKSDISDDLMEELLEIY